MFSFSFALISALILYVHGQNIQITPFPATAGQKLALFGQLQHSIDQSNRLSLSNSQPEFSEEDHEQPASISCYRVRPNVKNAVPSDNTKYFVCRNDFSYDIYSCPNGGVFDDNQKACLDLCQQNNPCFNEGQCIILPDQRLECVCRRDWTGQRCEIPLSSCAENPCGPNAECRMLKTPDYDQDYVCICDNQRGYGKSCQRTVPNPCLSNTQQFHPFAFSRRAYINCDDEMISFQPCNALLYWNQEAKRCAWALPDILRAPFMNMRLKNKLNEGVPMGRPQLTQWQSNNNDDANEEKLVVVMLQKPVTVEFTQWLETRMPEIQRVQQQNFPKPTQMTQTPQQWSNQAPSMQPPSSQRLGTPLPSVQIKNPPTPMKPFMETTTLPPKIFRLQGFATQPTRGQQSNTNTNMNMPMSQTGFDSNAPSFFETTTRTPGVITHSLSGWKSTPQQNTPPTMQLKSWKS